MATGSPLMANVRDGVKQILHETLRRAGFVMHRYSPATVAEAQISTLLRHHAVDLVLDVGANAGQYGTELRRAGYTGRILSFEPLSEAWARCAHRASNDADWDVAPRMALGASAGSVEINVAGNSASSSILAMRDRHVRAAPQSAYVGRESVDLRRLDEVAGAAVREASRPFLKVDTQGYEREVLAGASGVLELFVGIQLEMSLTPLYEGSPTALELMQTMTQMGFAPYALLPAFTDVTSGRMLQVDGLFFREPVHGSNGLL